HCIPDALARLLVGQRCDELPEFSVFPERISQILLQAGNLFFCSLDRRMVPIPRRPVLFIPSHSKVVVDILDRLEIAHLLTPNPPPPDRRNLLRVLPGLPVVTAPLPGEQIVSVPFRRRYARPRQRREFEGRDGRPFTADEVVEVDEAL